MISLKKIKICIIGIGYVGLPLALEFSKNFKVLAYDVDKKRISSLKLGIDNYNDLELNESKKLLNNKNLDFSSNSKQIGECNVYIITVPTPIFKNKLPNLKAIINSTKEISFFLKKNDLVIYESTVYPGTTREICIPILEKNSQLKLNKDFFVGYSPERLSPGDSFHGLKNVIKITSGSNKKTLEIVDKLYKSIIPKGTFKASSIEVAEAAKVIENTQRDINIAFINELVFILNKLNLSTKEVLEAASTKWNFINFKPGLVGGHCIAVDPYYLHYISKKKNYIPKLIRPARNINDNMAFFISKKINNELNLRFGLKKKKILILGFAYKENSSDTRNSPVYQIYKSLRKYENSVDIIDPIVNKKNVFRDFKIKINKKIKSKYDCIIFAVPHKEIIKSFNSYLSYLKSKKKNSFVFDIKYTLNKKNYSNKINILYL